MTELEPQALPQNPEAEASLLGALLLDPSLIEQLRGRVQPEDLSREAHRKLYRVILELADAGREPTFQAVIERLREKAELEAAGGPAAIVALIEGTPSPAHARGYASVVERSAMLRRIIGAAQEMLRLALTSENAKEAVERAQHVLFGVSESRLHREVVGLGDALQELFSAIEEQNEQGRGPALATGFRSLDELLGGGLHPGDLVIVAGRPGMGKTSLALNVMRNAALATEAVCAVFSLEMTEEDLTLRLLSSLAEIDGGRLRRGALDGEELKSISHASAQLMQRQIFIEECTRLDVTDVLTHARKLQVRQGRLDLVVIDYLQLMEGASGGGGDNRVQELGSISRGLKAIARELDVPVIALSQLSRQIERRAGGEPKLSDLRECVTGDTRVIDAETGRWVEVRALRPGMRVISLGPNQKLGAYPLSRVWSTGRKPTYRVTTQTGRTIRATGNHPFLTVAGWRELQSLRSGDVIATALRIPEHGNERPERGDLCRLLGYLAGDGSYARHRAVGFISSDEEAFADVISIIASHWPEITARSKPHPEGYKEAEFARVYENGYGRPHGNPLREWLRELGIEGQTDETKRVSEYVFDSGAVGAREFLAGYVATDGSVSRTAAGRWSVHFDSVSHGLVTDVQALLMRLGVAASIGRPRYDPLSVVPIYRLAVYEAQHNLRAFARVVSPRGPRGVRLGEILRDRDRLVTGPGVFALPRELSADLAERAVGWRDQGKRMRRSTALAHAQETGDEKLRTYAESDLLWETIREIEAAGVEEVFDLSVPGAGNFVANGIVVHNSGALEQDADIVVFLWKRERGQVQLQSVPILDVRVAKHRHGPTGDFQLYFEYEYTRFRELTAPAA